jgi:cytoskeletal protein CcmA (bactofilin family)
MCAFVHNAGIDQIPGDIFLREHLYMLSQKEKDDTAFNTAVSRDRSPATPRPQTRAEPAQKISATVLGKSVTIIGDIASGEDFTTDGNIRGIVNMPGACLTIGPNGTLDSRGITAREVVVSGIVHGDIEAGERVLVHSNAELVGDVRTPGIVIEDGARFKGVIDIQSRKP